MRKNATLIDEPTSEEQEAVLNALQSLDWLSDVADDVVTSLCEGAVIRPVQAGETLFTIGQYEATDVIGVVKGALQLTTLSDDSGQIMLSEVAGGQVVGLDLVLAHDDSAAAAIGLVAKSDSVLVFIDSAIVADLVVRKPAFARTLLTTFAQRIVEWRSGKMSKEEPAKRVYRYLSELIEQDARGEAVIPTMPKHRELAEKSGTTDAEAADAVAELIRTKIARRQYPGLVILNAKAFSNLTR